MHERNLMDEAMTIELALPATYDHISVLDGCLRAILAAVPDLHEREMATYNAELAVHEVCTNIVEHAYGTESNGRIQATLAITPAPPTLEVTLHDQGRAFDAASAPAPNLDEPQVKGYGLFLAYALMDEVSYRYEAGGNHWRLVKQLEQTNAKNSDR